MWGSNRHSAFHAQSRCIACIHSPSKNVRILSVRVKCRNSCNLNSDSNTNHTTTWLSKYFLKGILRGFLWSIWPSIWKIIFNKRGSQFIYCRCNLYRVSYYFPLCSASIVFYIHSLVSGPGFRGDPSTPPPPPPLCALHLIDRLTPHLQRKTVSVITCRYLSIPWTPHRPEHTGLVCLICPAWKHFCQQSFFMHEGSRPTYKGLSEIKYGWPY